MEKATHVKTSTNLIIKKALEHKRRFLLEPDAKKLCSEWGIPIPTFEVSKTRRETAEIADKIGYPIVLKVVSPDILHKTEVGGVLTSLNNRIEVEQAYDLIIRNVESNKPQSRIEGILVQKMMPNSIEVIVGGLRDEQFGPTVMFGLGGIFTEIFKDVAFGLAPLAYSEAMEMLDKIKARRLLKGYRGMPPADLGALADILVKTSTMIIEVPEIDELDLNPILAYEKGAYAVDSRIALSSRFS
jgi:acyl-CoA synthetase (NDP forming)